MRGRGVRQIDALRAMKSWEDNTSEPITSRQITEEVYPASRLPVVWRDTITTSRCMRGLSYKGLVRIVSESRGRGRVYKYELTKYGRKYLEWASRR